MAIIIMMRMRMIMITIPLITFLYYIHTEKNSLKSYVVNFRTQISYSQSEKRTMVLTREKNDTSNQNRDVFSRERKMIRPMRSHIGV